MLLNFISKLMNVSGHMLCSPVHDIKLITPDCFYLIDLEMAWKRICGVYHCT